jgi:hypothetical protein
MRRLGSSPLALCEFVTSVSSWEYPWPTVIPSYLVVRPRRDLLIAVHQQLTRDWWDLWRTEFDLCVSEKSTLLAFNKEQRSAKSWLRFIGLLHFRKALYRRAA